MFMSFGSFIFALILAEVAPWTIDLPEARKFLFEKNDQIEKKREQTKYEVEKRDFFSNRYYSNSKHHEEPQYRHDDVDHQDSDPYAKEYGYQSYTEKQVRGIVYEGSEYLEGLQRSIEHFTQLLENCTKFNQTDPFNTFNFQNSTFNMTSFNTTSFNTTAFNTNAPWRPMTEANATSFTEQCRRVTRASEHVRRLAELSIKATKELQDIAYSRKHMKEDPSELSKQENEQILKLAWFLDRLAYYTDFHPQPKKYFKEDLPTSTTARPPVALLNPSPATKALMMNCLKMKSAIPATIRCAYPEEIPSVVQAMINNTNPVPGGQPSSSNRNEKVISPEPATSEQELLIASDYSPMYQPYHHLSSVTHVKRSVLSTSPGNVRQKRAITQPDVPNLNREHPAITFMKYFVKHKVWDGANAMNENGFQHFEVNNEIPRKKRDIRRLRIPEDPYQDLSKYLKSKKGINYVKDEKQAQKIRAYIDKILKSKSKPKEQSRRISKLFRSKRSDSFRSETGIDVRSKRSLSYETDIDKPRNPDDLFKDISYYVKNRDGTNFNRDFVQAAQLRAGLLQIFANPNIETVRRYGSNFNPLIPDPLVFAALRSAADN